ncbi:MAG: Gx transporter family protein [Oscillospiraceae bacterium]|nr:Gx transporter family protein [Oscillospiraceae bacterium]
MNKTKQIALIGLFLALIAVLSAFEHMLLPPLPFLPPHMKPGLSNVIIMYCIFFIGKPQAVTLSAAKSLFVLQLRGPAAAVLSFCGGMVSVFVIILLITIFRRNISYIMLSAAGAIAHNAGQFAAVSVMLNSPYIIYYIPVLLVSGIIFGSFTGALLRVIMPAFDRIFK